MPLSFRSQNHGNVAFGFFNIESDMLLLEKYFFFADDFCELIGLISHTVEKTGDMESEFDFAVYHIENPRDIGDLMGAIHGISYTGFIGETYKRFPFPEKPEDFKQNPDGYKTRDLIIDLIDKIAVKKKILIQLSEDKHIHIGSYLFDIDTFHELILYVDRGGYPRWDDEKRPCYVTDMKNSIQKSSNLFFHGVFAEKRK